MSTEKTKKPDCRLCEVCVRFRCFRKARWVAENADGRLRFLCSKHCRGDQTVVSKEEWQETQRKAERVIEVLTAPLNPTHFHDVMSELRASHIFTSALGF